MEKYKKGVDLRSLGLSHAITSMVFTIHNIKRARLNSDDSGNIKKKAQSTEYKFMQCGIEFTLPKDKVTKAWEDCVKVQGLEYKKIKGKNQLERNNGTLYCNDGDMGA